MTQDSQTEKMKDQPQEPEQINHLWSRRSLLSYAGWGGLAAATAAAILGFIRFWFPRVLFEPPQVFTAGDPADYLVGEVNTKWIKDHRVWIVREKEGFYALLAICTHLGCTPGWLPAENKFKCFCHGSGFHKSGINYEGPAPRPLERVKITLAEDGQVRIDKSVVFRYEKGEWEKPGAYLKV